MAMTQQTAAAGVRTPLQDTLTQVVRRLRLARRLRLVSRGALVATCLSLLCVGCARLGLLPPWLSLGVTIPLLLSFGIGLGALAAAADPVDPLSAMRDVEARLGLKERLSSALEFERSRQADVDPEAVLLRRMQQDDAAVYALALRPAEAVPLRLPWELKALIPTFLLLLIAVLLPVRPVFIPPGLRAERSAVRSSGEELARTARVVEKRADTQDLAATRSVARDMRKLGREMAEGHMDRKQAMVQMARLSRRMADEQRRLAQMGVRPGQADKSLAQAGRELDQSMHPAKPGASVSPAGGKAGPAAGPATPPPDSRPSSSSPEMRKAVQAMKQGSISTLSQQLRALAQHAASRLMSPDEQQKSARELQKLSDALKGTPLSEAQKHVQPASDAMKHSDARRAVNELRRAAEAADHQAKSQQDAQGVQDAQQSLQSSRERLAERAIPQKTSAVPQTSGRTPGGGQSGETSGHGTQEDGRQSGAKGSAAASERQGPGRSLPGVGTGDQTPPVRTGPRHGEPHPLDARFDPTRNPKYGKIYLGAGSGGGGTQMNALPGARTHELPRGSSVPYYGSFAPAQKSAESAMDREDIPPAYRTSVREYFDSLRPTAKK